MQLARIVTISQCNTKAISANQTVQYILCSLVIGLVTKNWEYLLYFDEPSVTVYFSTVTSSSQQGSFPLWGVWAILLLDISNRFIATTKLFLIIVKEIGRDIFTLRHSDQSTKMPLIAITVYTENDNYYSCSIFLWSIFQQPTM